MKKNNRETGSRYEAQAAAYLITQNYQVIERNYRCRIGEIDIIARDQDCLVFIEVKYRKTEKNGDPAEAVNKQKQRKIIQAARYYLLTHEYGEDAFCRFDVVSILDQQIRLIKDAFWRY